MAKKKNLRNISVIILAYMHRYLYPILILSVPMLLTRKGPEYVLYQGIGLLVFAAYSLAGYLLRWKHIYCSYQNAYHQKMTPNRIRWNTIKKSDAYGCPAVFGVLGVLCILAYVHL
jgi:hypothetical protein